MGEPHARSGISVFISDIIFETHRNAPAFSH